MSMNDRLVKRIDSDDGKRFVELRERAGYYFFEELSEITDLDYTFMAPSHCSGLYATAAEAERDMIAELAWLRENKVR